MNTEDLKAILNSMLKERDFSNIANLVPYEERYQLYMKTHTIKIPDILYDMIMVNIFNQEEAEIIFNQTTDNNKKNLLFGMLSYENKIKHLNEVELEKYYIIKFIESIPDAKVKYDITCKYLNENKLSSYDIRLLFSSYSGEYQLGIFNILCNNIKTNNDILWGTALTEIIEKAEERNKTAILKIYIENKMGDLTTSIRKIIGKIPENERKNALLYMADSSNEKIVLFDGVLESFPKTERIDILKELLDRDKISTYTIIDNFKEISYEENIELIDFLINYSKEKNKIVIRTNDLANLIGRLPKDIGTKIYHKYVIETDYFDAIQTAKKLFKTEDKYYYLDYLVNNIKNKDFEELFNLLHYAIIDIPNYPSGDIEYPNIINIYVQKYNLNKEHLIEFIKRFNYVALKTMNSKSIVEAINLPDEEFKKFLNIFNGNKTLDNNIINTICNSFLQRQFRLENKEDYSIFNEFEMLLTRKTDNIETKISELLIKIGQEVNITIYLNKKELTIKEFIISLINNDKSSIDLLHDMTQEYIMKKREEYVKKELNTVFDKLEIEKKIEKQTYKKKFIETYSVLDILVKLNIIPKEYLTEEEQTLLDNNILLDKLINFKKNKKPLENPEDKKYLRIFESLLNKYYEYKYDDKGIEKDSKTPYTYYPKKTSDEWLLGIIIETNISQIKDKVLNNQEVYTELISFINKYQMLGWGKTFDYFNKIADIDFNEGTLASIISNFYTLSSIAKEKKANLTQFIDYANCYDSISKTYSHILGRDNYRLIAANEGKNKASMNKNERLRRIPNLIREMYNRTEITIPPIDEDYQTTTGKKINVVLGNSTNMINLSYGERTESCLRIGGAFNNLFNFCIQDKNGFHVRFTDPNTGEFISRVSGIRNGNTIFFNELRDSVNSNYSNEEIIEVLKDLSNKLIENTKEEQCPIDNIVITYDYAMRDYKDKAVPTELSDYPDAFYGLPFNISHQGDFVIIKTTNKEGKLVPYKFGRDLAQIYKTQRDKISTLTGEEAFNKITQLQLIDQVLKGKTVEELTIPEKTEIVSAIAGEDWCVYIDQEGKIKEYIVEMSNHKTRALKEIKIALDKIKEYTNYNQQSKKIGGLS